MSHSILLTGCSGYLGGTLLSQLPKYNLPPYKKLFALVRTDSQAAAVKQHGAAPLTFNTRDEAAVRNAIVDNEITIVFFLIDALKAETQGYFIKALAEVKKRIGEGVDVHFLHVSSS